MIDQNKNKTKTLFQRTQQASGVITEAARSGAWILRALVLIPYKARMFVFVLECCVVLLAPTL
jgi:hypothetical protein